MAAAVGLDAPATLAALEHTKAGCEAAIFNHVLAHFSDEALAGARYGVDDFAARSIDQNRV